MSTTTNSSINGSINEEKGESWLTTEQIASSPQWYMSMSIEILVILINCWISVSFLHYVLVKKLLSKKRRREDQLIGETAIAFALVAVFLPFFRYVGTIFLLVVGLYPGEKSGCEVANDVSVVGFALAVFPTYAYLWARQRAFYRHPSLNKMTGPCAQLFSKLILPLILLSACASVGLGIYPIEYEHGQGGCVLIGNEEQADYRTYIYAIVMISSQVCLLGLFLHPIILLTRYQQSIEKSDREKTEMIRPSSPNTPTSAMGKPVKGKDTSSSSDIDHGRKETHVRPPHCQAYSIASEELPRQESEEEANSNALLPDGSLTDHAISLGLSINADGQDAGDKNCRRVDKKLFYTVRRIFYLALIPIISDLLAMLINQFCIPDDVPQTYSFVLFDINVLIHVFTVVLSFAEWRETVFSPCIIVD